MGDEMLLYFRLIMYPLAALALTFITIMRSQDQRTPKGWIHLMIAGICVIMSFFVVELLLTVNPEFHEEIKSYILTPAITVLAFGGWFYVFRLTKQTCKIHEEKANGNQSNANQTIM